MGEVTPLQARRNLGTMTIEKGNLPVEDGEEEIKLYSWDAIQRCDPDTCSASHLCHYEKEGKCKAQDYYLRSVQRVIFKAYSKVLGEVEFFRIGMQLMPLYSQLSRMLIEELGTARIVYTNDKGTKKANPLFKEMRETIKLIELMWKSIGLDSVGAPDGPSGLGKGMGSPGYNDMDAQTS